MTTKTDLVREYEALQDRAREATAETRFRDALDLYERALELARALGEPERIDLATCSRYGITITLGDYDEPRGPLRQILMRRTSAQTAFWAAYSLARIFELVKDFKKGLFYARVAADHARAAESLQWLSFTQNQIGNCLLGESYFEDAAAAYERALDLLPGDAAASYRTGIGMNLGYCFCVLGDLPRAFTLAFKALRGFRRLNAPGDQGWAHLDLCHAYVQIERTDRARGHGERALSSAEASEDRDLVKNALFMLGETARLEGDIDSAFDYFERLQKNFYPDQPQLTAVMLANDLASAVNLRA